MLTKASARPGKGGTERSRARLILDNLEEIIGCAALGIVVLAAVWGVFTRYVTHTPATWTSEVATLAFAWVVFLGAGAAFKRGGHVSIDMLMMALPGRIARILQIATDLIVLGFCIYVCLLATEVSIANWDNPTSVLRLPVATAYLAVALGFASMAVRHAQTAWTRRGAFSAAKT